MPYSPSNLPSILTPDSVAEWAQREFELLAQELAETSTVELRPIYAEPVNPREGMIVYADGVQWDPGSGVGVYTYSGGAWVKL